MIQQIGRKSGPAGKLEYQSGFDYYRFKLTKSQGTDMELCRRHVDNRYPIQFVTAGLLEFEIKINFSWWFAVNSTSTFVRERRYYRFDNFFNFGSVSYSGCDPDFSMFTKIFSMSTTVETGAGIGRIAQFDGMGCAGQQVLKQMDGILKIRPESLSRFGTGAADEEFTVNKMNR